MIKATLPLPALLQIPLGSDLAHENLSAIGLNSELKTVNVAYDEQPFNTSMKKSMHLKWISIIKWISVQDARRMSQHLSDMSRY